MSTDKPRCAREGLRVYRLAASLTASFVLAFRNMKTAGLEIFLLIRKVYCWQLCVLT